MKKVHRLVVWSVAVLLAFAAGSCEKRETKSTWDLPDKENLTKWASMLDIRTAEPGELLATNDTRPSNVSPEVAITKALQALNSYEGETEFPLNTVYTIKRVNDAIVAGHYYYLGLLEFDASKPNGGAIQETGGLIPGFAVVDAEDETQPAVIRTVNAEGVPYKIKIHWESLSMTGRDDLEIIEWLDNHGFENRGVACSEVSAPKLECDDLWNPFITAAYLEDDGCGPIGTAWYATAFGIVDIQKASMEIFALDDPMTKDVNEGEDVGKSKYAESGSLKKQSEIPVWVDWVFSERLFIQMATHQGMNLGNYGKQSVLGDLILDGSTVNDDWEVTRYGDVIVDISMGRGRKDLVLVGYRTSRSNDMAVNSILTFNARTGKAVEHLVKGTENAMAVKSMVINVVEEAQLLLGEYYVQDLTLHTIFSRPTWEGILVRNAVDNEGNSWTHSSDDAEAVYTTKPLNYSTYAATVWVEASSDITPANIIFDPDYQLSMMKYRNLLYKQRGRRGIANILDDKKITGAVRSISIVGKQAVLRVSNSNLSFIVDVENAFDAEVGDVVGLQPGDRVYMVYGDQQNLDKVPVRILKRVSG